jgi:hypothetical protein
MLLDFGHVVGRHLDILEVAHVAYVLFSGVKVLQLVGAEFTDIGQIQAHLHDISLTRVYALPLHELSRLHSQVLLIFEHFLLVAVLSYCELYYTFASALQGMCAFGLPGEEVSIGCATSLGSSIGLPTALALASHGASSSESIRSGRVYRHSRLYLIVFLVELPPISQRSLGSALLIARVSIVLVSVEGRIGMGGFFVDEILDLFG